MSKQKLITNNNVTNNIIDTTWITQDTLCWLDLDGVDPMFLPATIQAFDGKQTVTILLENGKQQQCKPSQILERAELQITNQYYNGFEDMVNMETLNDAELLQNLIIRFKQDIIHTYVGPTLLVMNPFKPIPESLNPDFRNKYILHIVKNKKNYKDLEPHVFAVAAQAYRYLFENEKNQAIVISGESGAGKTENAKFAMKLLTSIASEGGQQQQQNEITGGIEDQILGCNPILEAFGNAKTVRNNNSSRFGKYVRIIVNNDTRKIIGAEIINYLLEKSRINQQGKSERNFHIFYILLKGLSQEILEKFHVNLPLEQFNYLNTSQTYTIPNVSDADSYQEIENCFKVLGMEQNYMNIVQVVFTVLLLGNLEFDDSTLTDTNPATIKNAEVAELLELDPKQFSDALTNKTRTVNKQVITSPLSIEECYAARDTLAKDLFDRLFNWLVTQLNLVLQPQIESKVAVGLLDIYGFEVFDKNGFEQIMINYTNEKLHQLYIQYVFKEEEKIFVDEGLQKYCNQIEFSDNTSVIELIDKNPGGVFSLLDESCKVKQNDDQLLQKIRSTHKNNNLLKNPKMPSHPSFIIVHTAKDVAYNTQGFTEKNKDEMSQLIQISLAKSANQLIKTMYDTETSNEKFISQKIKKEMQELMTELNSCDVHFIRCIKPNDSKKPQELWPEMTLKQIRYLGVLDSLKVRKESYAIRRQYQVFYKKYGNVTRNKIYTTLVKDNANFRDLVLQMFKDYFPELDSKLVLFGKTRIFLKQQGIMILEELYSKHMEERNKMTQRIQKAFKVHKMNQHLKKLLNIAMKLKMLAIRVRRRVKRKYKQRCIMFIQAFWKFKVRMMRIKKYQHQAELFQLFIKRYYNIQLSARQRQAVPILQRFCKTIIKQKHLKKQRIVKSAINSLFNSAWLEIENRQATIIQSYVKGWLCRRLNQKQVYKIKHAKRMVRYNTSVKLIQSNVRVFLAKTYLKKAHKSAYIIQGYFRMKILSDMFQRMRHSARLIQKTAIKYIYKQKNFREAFEQFIKPWEGSVQQQKLDVSSFWSLSNDAQYDECQPILESSLNLWRPRLQKIALVGVPIDIDVLSDLYQCYNPNFSYARTLMNIIIQQLRKDHPIQSYFVTEESTFCVTLGGCSIFEFGDGQLILNNGDSDQVEKVIFPDMVKIKSINGGDQHLLLTTQDGTLLQFGDQGRSIKYKPFVHKVQAQCSANNYIVSDHKLYSWIGVKFHLPIQNRVKCVCAGSQFALALCEGGQLYSWGENVEGELGLGDRIYRTEPTQVNLEKVLQISCGLKHAIARTRNKIYTWGWGERGQLGNSEFRNQLLPQSLNMSVLWVNCGRTSTSIISNERTVLWCGTNGTLSYSCKFEAMPMKLNISQNMTPIRVISTYSKVLEITYITYANTISFYDANTNKKFKILNNLINLWSESADPSSVNPPFNQALSNYLYEAAMHKPVNWNKQQIQEHYRMHKEQMFIQDDNDWAARKRELVEEIQKNQKSITTNDKLRAIKNRYQQLVEKEELTEEENHYLEQIHNNIKLYQLIQQINVNS